MRLEIEKWMASFKKTPTPKKSAEDLEAKGKMPRCLVEPKKPMLSDEILENEDEQMSKFYQEGGLSLEQLPLQKKLK
jgi:hypothetical protein